MAQSIMTFYAENILSNGFSRQSRRTIHWILQVIGSTLAVIGSILEFVSRWQHGKVHFNSTHSVLGLISMIFTLIAMFNGISALWSTELKQYVRPVYLKLVHTVVGIAAFVVGMIYILGHMHFNTHAFCWLNQIFYWLSNRDGLIVLWLRYQVYAVQFD